MVTKAGNDTTPPAGKITGVATVVATVMVRTETATPLFCIPDFTAMARTVVLALSTKGPVYNLVYEFTMSVRGLFPFVV